MNEFQKSSFNLQPQKIILLGDYGVGKTTFFNSIFKISNKDGSLISIFSFDFIAIILLFFYFRKFSMWLYDIELYDIGSTYSIQNLGYGKKYKIYWIFKF